MQPASPYPWSHLWLARTRIERQAVGSIDAQPAVADSLLDLLATTCFGCGARCSGVSDTEEICTACGKRRPWRRN